MNMPKFPKLFGYYQKEIQPIDCLSDIEIIKDHMAIYFLDGCQLQVDTKFNNISKMSCGHLHDGDLRERCFMCYFSRGHLPKLINEIKKMKIELIRGSHEYDV